MRYNTPHINHKVKFVSVNTFNIFEDKVKSYICNRQAVCFNNYVTTLASKLFTYSQIKNNSNDELLRILENIKPSLKSIKSYIRNGALNVNGRESNISNMHDKTFRENKLELINNPKITVKSLADINKDDFIIDDDL
jgi:prophage DNA circulation protein